MKLNDEKLEEPSDVEVVADGLVRVPLKTPTLPPATRTNSFLVRGDGGWVLVDVGPSDPDELERLERAIEDHVPSGELAALFLTHHHPDHLSGLHWFIDRFDAPIVSGEATWKRHHHNIERAWELVENDGDEIVGLRAIRTDGHAPDHFALLNRDGHLVAGDIISGMGTIVIAPPDGNMSDYYASLQKLIEMNLTSIHPAHGPGTSEPTERLRAYLEHRRSREERVISALSTSEPRAIEQIVEVAYSDVDPKLHVFARGTVRAYLDKLYDEGRVNSSEDGRTWKLTG